MKKKILYVEDSPEIQEITLNELIMLSPESEIITANSGNKAKTILEQAKDFDFIITDYQMDDGDGLDLIYYCKKKELNIPIIVFHSGSIKAERFFLASSDCLAVVIKPNYNILKNHLKKRNYYRKNY